MKRYLITGFSGFVSYYFLKHLNDTTKEKIEVLGLDINKPLDFEENYNFNNLIIRFIPINLLDYKSLEIALTSFFPDYILHLAALISVPRSIENPEETFFVNTQGTINILEFAKNIKAKKVVLSSSAAIYGDKNIPPCAENAKPACQSPYALSKLQAEESLKMYYSLYNLPTVCLRYFNAFGPGQNPNNPYAAVIAKFIDCFIKKQPLTIFGDGLQTRDFIFVKDIARSNVFAALNLGNAQVYNIATGWHCTLLELVDILSDLFKYKPEIIFKPTRAGDIKESFADISKISALGFKTNYSLKQGLKEMLKGVLVF